ncbi:MAG: PilZ domain-containing protein [Pseudomonadota bacterium]|nr:PilZ domain-containing protein [Pseudomonadota bacterium]
MAAQFNQANSPERRTRKRRAANTLAWADPGGILPVIDCKILDITDAGARIAAPVGFELPDMFQLQIDSSRIVGAAEVVWRGSNQVGVKFLTRI